jgi:hypothetical protein
LAIAAELIPTLPEGARWAGVSVYALSGTDPEILRPLVADADPRIAVLAASGLAHRGEIAGLKGLVAALSAEGFLPGSIPPMPLWVFATDQLVSMTHKSDLGPPFDAETPEVLAAAQRWRAWLAENENELTFAEGVWRA